MLSASTAIRGRARLGTGVMVPVAACVAALTLFLGIATLARTAGGASSTLDFSAFYTAGHLVRDGLGGSLYDLDVQEAAQRELSGENYDEPLPYAGPAFVAFVYAPLTLFPLNAAFGVMLLVNLAALAAVLAVLNGTMKEVPPRLRAVALGVTALGIPTVSVLTAGQIDLLVTGTLLAGLLLLRADRHIAAGVVLGLAFAKPQLTLGVLVLLVATREWRALTSMLATGLVLALLPVAAFGTQALTGNLDALDAVGRPALMANWRGFMASAGAPDDLWLWVPGWAAIAAAALLLAWRVFLREDAAFGHRAALALMLPLLLTPHLHGQTLVLALPAVALFLQAEACCVHQATPGQLPAWEARATSTLLLLFVALFARWALALAGLSLGVFLLAALFVAIAMPELWRLGARSSEPVRAPAEVSTYPVRPFGLAYDPVRVS